MSCSVPISSVVIFIFPRMTFGRAVLELPAVNECGRWNWKDKGFVVFAVLKLKSPAKLFLSSLDFK